MAGAMPSVADTALGRMLERLDKVSTVAGGFRACCPAHDDQHPSLSIREGDDGRILLHCWAGCKTADVLAALGLSWADLFPPTRTRSRR